jgi:hypothetical protein
MLVPENIHREKKMTEAGTSTPVAQSLPLKISSHNAIRQPFSEYTTTFQISCHGCKFRSKQFVLKGTKVTLEIPSPFPGVDPNVVSSTVVGSRKPEARGTPFEIEVVFETPANVWGIAFPPDDWHSFKRMVGQVDQEKFAARALGGDVLGNNVHVPPAESSHVLPFVPHAERSAAMPEPPDLRRQETERLNARFAELEQKISQLSRTLADMPAAQAQASRPEASQHEAALAAAAKLERAVQAAVGGMEGQIDSKMQLLREAEQRLAASQTHLDDYLRAASDRAREAADQCVRDAAGELAKITANAKADVLAAASSTAQEQTERISSESARVTQATFDSLHQAAEWCRGKAQAGIQSHLDKTLEQSAASLQEKALEVCNLFASELEQYSRRYVTHTQKLIEVNATEQIENSREQLMRQEKEIQAGFEASFQNVAENYRKRLDELTAATLEEAKARVLEMFAEQDSQFRINAAEGAASFRDRLSQHAANATEEAVRGMESSFSALLENMRQEAEGQSALWNEKKRKELDESIAQFRQSLETVSNSCRAATAALLMQDSQKLKDKLAAGLMYGLQQSAVKGCVELARVLSQKSIAPATGLTSGPREERKEKDPKDSK